MGEARLSRREWIGAAGLAGVAVSVPAVAAGQDPARLSLNENAFGPSPEVPKAIARATPGLERYVGQDEADALATRIAALEGVSPDQIVIGEVLEALGLFLARRRTGGGSFVYSTPGYTALIDAAAPLGGRGVAVPLNAKHENDLPALAAAIDASTLAVSLVNPHNPSGTVNDTVAFDRFVLDAARRRLVVVDEAYLEYDDFAGRSAIRHVRSGANVLVFRTLAKIYGLAGLSIGYAVAPAPLARDLRAAGIGAPHSLSRLALAAADAALGDQTHVRTVRDATLGERVRVTRELDRLGYSHSDSRANFIFFRPSGSTAELRAKFDRAGIRIARPFPPLEDWIRITIGRPAENDRVIAVLRG
ncbi:histidinol-phosphate transaminase [Sphingomonas sp. G-3-2-10]|uniref:pyridoxal phosphate-dependent aminotransferase n=1 Tax=Sphingomonas sp. G-3-2-10 TaxID=2728838 RepID=UPI00146D15A3|nr:histidinol-phosphate transaminase [Sphingomonas sp. G-3-2-10]NML07833.1 histidinol-phosphate aminotransferase family protein [Sphingomonas sp. G-3-2-10]